MARCKLSIQKPNIPRTGIIYSARLHLKFAYLLLFLSCLVQYSFVSVSSMTDLLISWACDAQDMIISPNEAITGCLYFCPACRTPLSLKGARAGAKRRKHFAHRPDTQCSPESIVHETAKKLVKKVVNEWVSGVGPSPTIMHRCRDCRQNYVGSTLPSQVSGAALERYLPNGYRVDVGILAKGRTRAAVEIRVTHPVGEVKAGSLSIPFVELSGSAIVEDPYNWYPLLDGFQPRRCIPCEQLYTERTELRYPEQERMQLAERAFLRRCEVISRATSVTIPANSYFRYALCPCRRCEQVILVFDWPEHRSYSEAAPKGSPVPRTLRRWIDRKSGDKYWVNSCPHCGGIQWVDQLCCRFDSVFGKLYYTLTDTPDLYREHMNMIISRWEQARAYYQEGRNAEAAYRAASER